MNHHIERETLHHVEQLKCKLAIEELIGAFAPLGLALVAMLFSIIAALALMFVLAAVFPTNLY